MNTSEQKAQDVLICLGGSPYVGQGNLLPRTNVRNLVGPDLLRAVAVTCIVWFHCQSPLADLTNWRVPSLLLLSVSLSLALGGKDRSFKENAAHRARRLLIPWLAWSAFYGLLHVCVAVRHGQPPFGEFQWTMLFTGPEYHLWYLPFAFAMWVVCDRIRYLVLARLSPQVAITAAALGGLAVLAACMHRVRPTMVFPFPQYVAAAPAVLLGLFLGLMIRNGTRGRRALGLGALLACVAAIGVLTKSWDQESLLPRYFWAFIVTSISLLIPWRYESAKAKEVATSAMGVYLLHPFLMLVLYAMKVQPSSVPFGIAAVTLSWCCAFLLRKTPLRAVI